MVREQDALEQIVDRHYDRVFSYCLAILTHRERAEDACHDVFLKVQNNLDRLDHGRDCTPWLLRIARNHCYDILRKEQRLSLRGDLSDTVRARSPGPEEQTLARDRAAAVVQAINELAPDYREVLVLRDITGLTYADIARHLEIDSKKVKWMLYKARQRLRSVAGAWDETP